LSIPDFRRSDTESGGRKATRTDVGLPTLHYSFSVWGSSRVRGSGFGSPENRINPWFSARHRQRRFTSFRCGGTHAPRHHHRYSSAVIATQNGLYLVVTESLVTIRVSGLGFSHVVKNSLTLLHVFSPSQATLPLVGSATPGSPHQSTTSLP